MEMTVAVWLLRLVVLYVGAGCVFAVLFVARGVSRIDPAARGAHPVFRIMVFPGVVALWPLLAMKWAHAGPQEPHS